MMAQSEQKGSLKTLPRKRLLPRLAAFVIMHSSLVSIGCALLGLVTLLLLPVLAKAIFVDENALLPGSARATFSHSDALYADRLANELHVAMADKGNKRMFIQAWLKDKLDEFNADYHFQVFCPPIHARTVLPVHATEDLQCNDTWHAVPQEAGINVVGTIRASRGGGDEAVVLVTPFQAENISVVDALSLGLSLALLQLFSKSLWLAKDVIWLAADARYGSDIAVDAWLKEYHEFVDLSKLTSRSLAENSKISENDFNDFIRAGSIAAGLVLSVQETKKHLGHTSLRILPEASNGQMPNLDLISTVHSLVTWRQGLRIVLNQVSIVYKWTWLKPLGKLLDNIGAFIHHLHPKWGFRTSGDEYLESIATFLRSIWNQVMGVPSGCHGGFRDYQVDAATLQVEPMFNLGDDRKRVELLTNIGRLLEGVIRSVNNLLEKFHASVFLYFLVSPSKFVSISTYIIPFALFLAILPLEAAGLCFHLNENKSVLSAQQMIVEGNFDHNKKLDGRWLQAFSIIVLVELCSVAASVIPAIALGFSSIAILISTWIFSLVLLVAFRLSSGLYSKNCTTESGGVLKLSYWIHLKVLALGFTAIGLGVLSAVNFAVSLLGVLLLLPMCTLTQPMSRTWQLMVKPGPKVWTRLFAAFAPLFVLLTATPLLIIFYALFLESPETSSMLRLWDRNVVSNFWGNGLHLFVFLLHLPCSIISIYIMLLPQ